MKKQLVYLVTLVAVSSVGLLIMGCGPDQPTYRQTYQQPKTTIYATYTSAPPGAKVYFGRTENDANEYLCTTPCKRNYTAVQPHWIDGYIKAEKSGYKTAITRVTQTYGNRDVDFKLESIYKATFEKLLRQMKLVTQYYRVKEAESPIYANPSANDYVVATMKRIDVVRVSGILPNGWLQVYEGGEVQGYIHSATVQLENGDPTILNTELSVQRRKEEMKNSSKTQMNESSANPKQTTTTQQQVQQAPQGPTVGDRLADCAMLIAKKKACDQIGGFGKHICMMALPGGHNCF